jgi:hypothetical protein
MIRYGFRDRTSDAIVAVKRRPIIKYNVRMKILFLHGWQSIPGGVKPTFLAQHGHEFINPKLPDEDFNETVRIDLPGGVRQAPAAGGGRLVEGRRREPDQLELGERLRNYGQRFGNRAQFDR